MNQFYPSDVLQIPHATESQTDAAQYMYRIYKGQKVVNYNLCGEFCVAYCMEDNTGMSSIDDFLDYWQAKTPSLYNSWIYQGRGRTTGINDLKGMLDAYGAKYLPLGYISGLQPESIAAFLGDFQAIVGVKIDNIGYLVGSGIPHWEVMNAITVANNGRAIVDLYNPFTNSIEPYELRRLLDSMGPYKQGLWIER